MGTTQSIGALGEEKAAEYLVQHGFTIIDRNFRIRGGEIDIVARHEKMIIFVEVKLRSSTYFGMPLESIHQHKLRALIKTGYFYLKLKQLESHPFRFDAIEVTPKDSEWHIHHLKNITL